MTAGGSWMASILAMDPGFGPADRPGMTIWNHRGISTQ
jgi:hypothetical protein